MTPRFSRTIPLQFQQELIAAARLHDLRKIDLLTDVLASQGFVRPRSEDDIKPDSLAVEVRD
jgi:hypothetical protein